MRKQELQGFHNGNQLLEMCEAHLSENASDKNVTKGGVCAWLQEGYACAGYIQGSGKAMDDREGLKKALCCIGSGYIQGIADAHEQFVSWGIMERKWCMPKGIETAQLIRVVMKYLREHPQDLHLSAGDLTAAALRAAFPCRQ